MNKNIFILSLFLSSFIFNTSAQDISFPELGGYRKNISYSVYRGDSLREYDGNIAENYLLYRFKDLSLAEYSKGKNQIRVEIFRFEDESSAFGVYSIERLPSYRFINLGTQGYRNGGYINFLKGRFYVRLHVSNVNEKNMQVCESLSLRIANMLAGNPEMPAVLSRFPETGRKSNEEIFINQNVLGHKFLANAFRASYLVGPDEFSIYILETGSVPETISISNAYLRACGEDDQSSDNGKFVILDPNYGTTFLAWQGNTIVIITGLSKDQADIADQYSSEILR